MNIVILGGTGYLGSRILRMLADNGHRLLCICRKPQEHMGDEQIEYCDLSGMSQRLQNFVPDIYINAIGRYLKGESTESEVLEANFEIPARVLHTCIASGVRRVITFDTALPDEFNMYTFSKKLFSDLGQWYANQRRVEFINISLEMFYGIGEPENRFLPWVIHRLVNDMEIPLTEGSQKRDMVCVEDVLTAVNSLISVDLPRKYVDIPLGSGEAPTIREVIEYLHELAGSQSKLLFGKVPMRHNEPSTIADREKMGKWGISIKYHWKEGLKMLVNHALEKKAQSVEGKGINGEEGI